MRECAHVLQWRDLHLWSPGLWCAAVRRCPWLACMRSGTPMPPGGRLCCSRDLVTVTSELQIQ